MPYSCFDNTPSFTVFLLYNTLFVGLALLTVGIVTSLLWMKLRGPWRYMALALLLLPVGFMSAGPVGLKWKMFKAERLMKAGDWSSSSPSYTFSSPKGHAQAFRINLGSKCRRGFIVKTDGYPLSLDTIYADSPDLALRYQLATYLQSPYNMCHARLRALYDDDGSLDLSRKCLFKQPQVAFSRTDNLNPYAFEMEWCRPIDKDTFFYCEADEGDVSLAAGNKF